MDNIEDFRICVEENYDEILDCGFTKPSSRLLITDKVDVVQSVALHHVILKTLGELSQFREGLETLRVTKAMEHSRTYLRDFFVIQESEITAGMCVETVQCNTESHYGTLMYCACNTEPF